MEMTGIIITFLICVVFSALGIAFLPPIKEGPSRPAGPRPPGPIPPYKAGEVMVHIPEKKPQRTGDEILVVKVPQHFSHQEIYELDEKIQDLKPGEKILVPDDVTFETHGLPKIRRLACGACGAPLKDGLCEHCGSDQ